jgi:hypothetical protein
MKPKTSTFDAQNLQTAQIILQNEARHGGAASLLARWAHLVLERAQTDGAPEPGGQPGLFEAEAVR